MNFILLKVSLCGLIFPTYPNIDINCLKQDNMGASGWSYFVKYEEDINEALQKLRWREFESKKYNEYLFGVDASSPDDLLNKSGYSGTHSIIDIMKISDTGFLGARALSNKELLDFFKTDKPIKDMILEKEIELMSYRSSWFGLYVIVYKNDKPDEIFFTGHSGD